LRTQVWTPLEAHLPPDTRVVLVAPDGALMALPWAALPAAKEDEVLLEQYALAVVPHGPFLLEQLTVSEPLAAPHGGVLAVGGVYYGQRPRPLQQHSASGASVGPGQPVPVRPAERGRNGKYWPYLPESLREASHVLRLADRQPRLPLLSGADASTERLLVELPRARWALLATHGFFADPTFRSAARLDEADFRLEPSGERAAPGARNPLVLSGLALAGANLKAGPDGGVLTAEAIAGLPLGELELAVLSACESGLGEVAGGEGVLGLQRAFHLAGCPDVVATLWRVDDDASAALVKLLFHRLWYGNLSPMDALRRSQLDVYLWPELVAELARAEGPDFDRQAARLDAGQEGHRPGVRSETKRWAAFVLSGAGRHNR
jgi:CHAT domain-containing protein